MRRVTFDVSEELFNDLNDVVPWGIRQRLMTSLVIQIVTIGRDYGEVGLAAVISNKVNLKTSMEVMLDGYTRRSQAVASSATAGTRDVSGPSSPSKPEGAKEAQGSVGDGGTDTKKNC